MARRTKPTIDDELIDKLLEGREHGAGLLGNDGQGCTATPGYSLQSGARPGATHG